MQNDYKSIDSNSQDFMITLDSILEKNGNDYIIQLFSEYAEAKQTDYFVDKSLILYSNSPILDLTDFFLEKLKEQPFEFDELTQNHIEELFQSISKPREKHPKN